MSTSVDLPTALLSEIQLRAAQQGQSVPVVVIDLLRKGLDASGALPNADLDSSDSMQRRREIAEKFISGEWGAELEGFEAGRAADREVARRHAEFWSE